MPQLFTSRRAVQRFLPSWRLWRRQWLGRGTPLENSSASASAAAPSLRLAARAITWSMTQTSPSYVSKECERANAKSFINETIAPSASAVASCALSVVSSAGSATTFSKVRRSSVAIRFLVLSAGSPVERLARSVRLLNQKAQHGPRRRGGGCATCSSNGSKNSRRERVHLNIYI